MLVIDKFNSYKDLNECHLYNDDGNKIFVDLNGEKTNIVYGSTTTTSDGKLVAIYSGTPEKKYLSGPFAGKAYFDLPENEKWIVVNENGEQIHKFKSKPIVEGNAIYTKNNDKNNDNCSENLECVISNGTGSASVLLLNEKSCADIKKTIRFFENTLSVSK